ncbi:glycosyltransferase [Hespellia stercorisuis]|uniref:Glycosyltransferase involved in cell wall bisynthesis n=1 Tax=Hespellia stercorisuis DSM 15480 TaxID=1121950 RepID=A0A1M6JXY2_9FIRM|nr:glycosyltransferase [Hespellia stercorisuis]SHJ51567.1 Glycosyltransferase involved in cell wall bisynthesis [Hespellia stercorisuis DSM 15480]
MNNNIENIIKCIKGKKVVFVSTKNKDYIRNTQEINLLTGEAEHCEVIASGSSSYVKRVLYVYWHLLRTLIKKRYDVIFIGFAPQLLLPFYAFMKKPVIIDFFISMYDTFVDDRKKVKAGSVIAGILHSMDKYVLKKADHIVCDTRAHRDYFVDEFGEDQSKFNVYYLEADTSIYSSAACAEKKSNTGKFNVLYFGSILPLQGVDVILKAAHKLQDEDEIKFVIIGPLEKKYDEVKRKMKNTEFIDWLPQQELAKKIMEADLCLAGHFSGTIGKANRTIAGKTYIYKAMKKPVILGDSAANRELFEEDAKENFYVPRGDAQALSDCIRKIYCMRNNGENV